MDAPSRRRFLRRSLAVGAALTAGCLDDAAPATDTVASSPSDGNTPVRTTPPATTPTDTHGGVWTFEDGTELTDLAVGDDAAVVGDENGRLYAFDVPGE